MGVVKFVTAEVASVYVLVVPTWVTLRGVFAVAPEKRAKVPGLA